MLLTVMAPAVGDTIAGTDAIPHLDRRSAVRQRATNPGC